MARGLRFPFVLLTRSPGAVPQPAHWGPAGWLPMPTSGPAPLQIGVFGDRLLNQFPAMVTQPQLRQGVEGLDSSWYSPSVSVVPSFQQTQQLVALPGGQRNGQTYTGPLGPISSKKMQSRVVAGQIRQSGLQAMEWAQGLTGA